ncbi:Muniscin C-terminal mu homology domain-containing protein [Pyronema omphalodes]|nr:Muniscin C-terminal mu homology domain-containing protein [Pyronema omphalodes]
MTTAAMEQIELDRSEYPTIVNFVQPSPAVKLLRDRLHKGQILNNEIADWIQERRRAEDAYVQALTKLAKRPFPGEITEMGVFTAPWTRIVESTSALAAAHHQLSQKLDSEVERPIREFASRNSEWAGMKVMESNLSAVAKLIDSTEERADRLRRKGTRAKATHVAEAAQAVSNAHAEWDSQAPFVFEKLQAADESRCNHLRDALTRLQTLELDHAQASVQSASEVLTVILDINTTEEIKAFAHKATYSRPKIERQQSRTLNHATYPATPSIVTDDSVSVRSSGSGGVHSVGGTHGMGLKRLGTVLRNRSNRNSIFHRSGSPDKRRGSIPPLPPSPQNSRDDSLSNNVSTLGVPGVSPIDQLPPQSPQSNGNHHPLSPPPSSGGPPSVTVTLDEPRTDSEGYTIRPAVQDLAASALPDEGPEESQPQFKVEIKNDVIHEEEEEADAALSKVAETLRAQNTVSRKTRGRRDVRNTVFYPNPELTPDLTGSPPLTPMRMPPRSPGGFEDNSDTRSIKSAHSVNSLAANIMRHPDLLAPGLSASLIESVSITFEAHRPVKTLVHGEIALAYNPLGMTTDETPITLRMDNFSVLEKVAPNPTFITSIPDHAGSYHLAPQNLHNKTAVAFKYQVHLASVADISFSPIIVTPVWRLEDDKASVIVTYKPNPQYHRLAGFEGKPFTLRNLAVIVGVDGAHAASCQSKPQGTFHKDKGRLKWALGDITVDPQGGEQKLLARFQVDQMARAVPVEVKWEVTGEDAETVGSGLTLSREVRKGEGELMEIDPFADEDGEKEDAAPEWEQVNMVRKVMSGRFTSS